MDGYIYIFADGGFDSGILEWLERCKIQIFITGFGVDIFFLYRATGFTYSYFSMGNECLPRLYNVVKITYQILLIFNEAYIIGWIRRKIQKEYLKLPVWSLVLIVAIMSCTVFGASNKAGTFTTYATGYYLKIGEAAMFYQEYMQRKMILEHSMDIVLKPYQYRPWLLYIDDITTDPNDWRNSQVAYWYGKTSVRLEE